MIGWVVQCAFEDVANMGDCSCRERNLAAHLSRSKMRITHSEMRSDT
jgi:hypothetical protein